MRVELRLLQILVIKADGRGDYRISGREDGDEVKTVEDHPIAYSKSFSLADECDAGGGGELMAAAGVVKHRETIIIAFDENAYDGGDPTNQRDECENQDTDDINRLPQTIAEGQADTANHVFAE